MKQRENGKAWNKKHADALAPLVVALEAKVQEWNTRAENLLSVGDDYMGERFKECADAIERDILGPQRAGGQG